MLINKKIRDPKYNDIAIRVLNKLRAGSMVFGNPAEGLKITLKKLEQEDQNLSMPKSKTDWQVKNKENKVDINKLKAGIKGEESLASHLQKIIKYNKKLDGLVAFASLSIDPDRNKNNEDLEDPEDYIPDSDFLCVYGNHIMVLDSKAINTDPLTPLYLHKNEMKILSKTLFEVKPSTPVWKSYLRKNRYNDFFINGCIVVVNNTGCFIWKNEYWYKSDCRPIYIGDLEEHLVEWIESIEAKHGPQKVSLELLSIIASTQIRKDKTDLDTASFFDKFKI